MPYKLNTQQLKMYTLQYLIVIVPVTITVTNSTEQIKSFVLERAEKASRCWHEPNTIASDVTGLMVEILKQNTNAL